MGRGRLSGDARRGGRAADGSRAGFTLVEALVAVTIASVVIGLVATLFLVQNEAYTHTLARVRTQDDARTVAALVAEELRAVPPGGVLVADSTRLLVRRPLSVGGICGRFFWIFGVHLPGGTAAFDTGDVGGVAVRADDGAWTFQDRAWSTMYAGTWFAPALCATGGAQVGGALSDFHLFGDLAETVGVPVDVGDVVMFYENLQLRFDRSILEPGTRALYRGTPDGVAVELATGLGPGAHFSYRRGGPGYVTQVVGPGLAGIDGVRIHAATIGRVGGPDTLRYELVADVRLRNRN